MTSFTAGSYNADLLENDPSPELQQHLQNLLHEAMPGSEGERWKLVKYLAGTKAKSAVYKATHSSLGTIALKFQATRDSVAKRRFKREILMLSGITDEYIVAAINAEKNPILSPDNTIMVGVLEFVQGKSVDGLLRASPNQTLEESVVVKIACSVLRGLTRIHLKNIVH